MRFALHNAFAATNASFRTTILPLGNVAGVIRAAMNRRKKCRVISSCVLAPLDESRTLVKSGLALREPYENERSFSGGYYNGAGRCGV
jgi:hypothetical protein